MSPAAPRSRARRSDGGGPSTESAMAMKMLFLGAALSLAGPGAHALDNGLALTPPLGWRSWNCYPGDVDDKGQDDIVTAADADGRDDRPPAASDSVGGHHRDGAGKGGSDDGRSRGGTSSGRGGPAGCVNCHGDRRESAEATSASGDDGVSAGGGIAAGPGEEAITTNPAACAGADGYARNTTVGRVDQWYQ